MIQVKILKSKEAAIERDINDCLRKFSAYPNCQIVNINTTYSSEKDLYLTSIIYDVT